MKFTHGLIAGILTAGCLVATPDEASAQEPMIGEVREFAFNFCPRGWAKTEGQLMAINQHQALFSLLGTQYGGDGRTTFGLPDSRPKPAASSAMSGGEVKVYADCAFKGWDQSVGLGNYQPGGFGANASFVDNQASSLRIPDGWEVVLYDGPNFDGQSVTLSSDESCLVGRNMNDKVSSMTVRKKAAPAPVASGLKLNSCIALMGIYPSRN